MLFRQIAEANDSTALGLRPARVDGDHPRRRDLDLHGLAHARQGFRGLLTEDHRAPNETGAPAHEAAV
jgi:hypothetical protein